MALMASLNASHATAPSGAGGSSLPSSSNLARASAPCSKTCAIAMRISSAVNAGTKAFTIRLSSGSVTCSSSSTSYLSKISRGVSAAASNAFLSRPNTPSSGAMISLARSRTLSGMDGARGSTAAALIFEALKARCAPRNASLNTFNDTGASPSPTERCSKCRISLAVASGTATLTNSRNCGRVNAPSPSESNDVNVSFKPKVALPSGAKWFLNDAKRSRGVTRGGGTTSGSGIGTASGGRSASILAASVSLSIPTAALSLAATAI
mmetsp:Transcript_1896/g.8531  ORF Transcript_1896/g.8531 Transcript_1896/m.8531 type:complete len:266 (-) Transcript_1896:4418-5215(-)